MIDFIRENYFNKGEIMKRAGWTAKCFTEFLGKPDAEKIKKGTSKKIQYYLKSKVEEKEKTSKFKEYSITNKNEQENIELELAIKSELESRWFKPNDTEYIIHVGNTNSGKTYHAIEELRMARNGVYLCPLRLLAWEVYERFNKENILCNLITGEEKIIDPYADITSSTVEMCDYDKFYDVAIIDESFMIADKDRGKSWFKAIAEIQAKKVYIIINFEALHLIQNLLEILNRKYKTIEHKRLVPLEISPSTITLKNLPSKSILVCFSRIEVLIYKQILQNQNKKVAVLYGNLPPEVKKEQISLFVENKVDVMVATDVIGMGLNLPCDNIIFIKTEKFDGEIIRDLKPFEIKQIAGRAGRFGLSEKGTVSSLKHQQLNFIKKTIDEQEEFLFGYYGIDKKIFMSIPLKNYKARFKKIAELNIIPKKLQPLIKTESIKKYIELGEFLPINELNPNLAWAMFNVPIKENNKWYWEMNVARLAKNMGILPPNTLYPKIKNIDDLKQCEDIVAEIDLFLYFCNNPIISKHIDSKSFVDLPTIKIEKETIIEKINLFLIEVKLSKVKFCKGCKEPMGWVNYNYCKDCNDNDF